MVEEIVGFKKGKSIDAVCRRDASNNVGTRYGGGATVRRVLNLLDA